MATRRIAKLQSVLFGQSCRLRGTLASILQRDECERAILSNPYALNNLIVVQVPRPSRVRRDQLRASVSIAFARALHPHV